MHHHLKHILFSIFQVCLQRVGEEKEHMFLLNNWVRKSDVADGWKEIPIQREQQPDEEKEDEDEDKNKEENEKNTKKDDKKKKGEQDEHNEDNKDIEKKPEEKSSPAPTLPGN